jgi:hypothetical protein
MLINFRGEGKNWFQEERLRNHRVVEERWKQVRKIEKDRSKIEKEIRRSKSVGFRDV